MRGSGHHAILQKRLSGVTFGGGASDDYEDSYCYQCGYNQAGRVLTQEMAVNAATGRDNSIGFTATYQWDDEGRMTSLQYPTVYAVGSFGNTPVTMPTAAYQYDPDGRLSGMTMDNGSGPQPFANATYTPAGQLYQLSYGYWTETRTYNSMMQLISQSVPGALNMTYNYSATQNNGRIIGLADGITGENTTYTYDALNRLTAASNSLWSTTYAYDGFGNLTSKAGSGGSPNAAPTMSATYNANNQQNGVYYDANGNQGDWGGSDYGGNTYSVENRLVWEVEGGWPYPANVYAYDPWGKRVMNGSDPSLYSPDPTYNYNFYGITGQKLVTLTCNGSNYPGYPTCEISQNAYFGKKLIVSGGVNVVTDRLGSVRANSQGESFAYYPYGEERTSTVDSRDKFATYFRDMVGQDYADQRHYGSGTGRFMTADPGRIKTAVASRPSSWNRYAYANGDPVNFNDPHGKIACDPDEDDSCDADDDDDSNDGDGGGGCAADTCITVTATAPIVPVVVAQAGGVIAIPIGEAIGGIICVGSGVCEIVAVAAAATGAVLVLDWALSNSRRLITVRADCSVHQNGTPDHASVGTVIGTGQGNNFSNARISAYSDAQARVFAQFGVGFHAQHCHYTRVD
jgi:RHS repeat-associated protein